MDRVGFPFVAIALFIASYLLFAQTVYFQSCVLARRTIVRKAFCPSSETALYGSSRVYPRAECLCSFLATLFCESAKELGIQMLSSVAIGETSGGNGTNENRFGTDLLP